MQTPNLRIEQVEMIRRLRNSGVSLQQITEAYQVFSRLDNEFGSFGTVKVTQSNHQIPSTSNHISAFPPLDVQCNVVNQGTIDRCSDHSDRKRSFPPTDQNNSAQIPIQQKGSGQNQSKFSQLREGLVSWSGRYVGLNDNNSQPYDCSPDTSRLASHDQCMSSSYHDDSVTKNLFVSESPCLPSSSLLKAKQGVSFLFDNKSSGNANDVKTLPSMMTNESALKEAGRCMLLSATANEIVDLIRKCSMTVENFDPCQLCTTYGLSHEELSKILKGHIPNEGEHGLMVVDWFVNMLIKYEWFISDVVRYSQQMTTPKQTEVVDVDIIPRRERFTFRDVHLEVMESYFKMNQYPSQKVKEMVANECNIKMAMASNSELTEKERVTHINVDHWFRNKRKEMFRRAKLEKIDVNNRVILPSPVKSPRRMIDSTSSEGIVEKEGYHHSALTALQPLHAFTSVQASELDKSTSSLANGENQIFQASSPSPQTKSMCPPNQSQFLNPSVSTDDKSVPKLLQAMEEVSQAASASGNEANVVVKTETLGEDESTGALT